MVGITLMWSIAGVVSRQLERAEGLEVTFWRSAFNALALAVALPLVHGPRRFFASIASGGLALVASSLCWSVMYTAFMIAIMRTSVANVLVTLAVCPLFTAVLARFVLGQRLAPRTIAAIAAATLGIAWMYGREVGASDARSVQGMLIALAVPITGAVNWMIVQRNQRGPRRDLVPAVLLGAVLSAAATAPFSVPFQASAADLGWLGLLGVVQLALPCSLVMVVARSLSAPEVALLALLEVLFGVLWAWLGAGEVPSRDVLLGGTVVLTALVTNELLGAAAAAKSRPST